MCSDCSRAGQYHVPHIIVRVAQALAGLGRSSPTSIWGSASVLIGVASTAMCEDDVVDYYTPKPIQLLRNLGRLDRHLAMLQRACRMDVGCCQMALRRAIRAKTTTTTIAADCLLVRTLS